MYASKNIYFISDLHLGAPNDKASREREALFLQWLDEVAPYAEAIYLVGDIFDFWFEYKHVVPRGFVRTLGKLASLTDNGLPIYFFRGNHDMWTFDYLEKEVGLKVLDQPHYLHHMGKKYFIAHGDGRGPGEYFYKTLKWFFNSWFCQRLFALLHPYIGMGIAQGWSKKSRTSHIDESFMGTDKEYLVLYCEDLIQKGSDADHFIFGHRHLPLDIELSNGSRYINLGDWLTHYTYGVLDATGIHLERYQKEKEVVPS